MSKIDTWYVQVPTIRTKNLILRPMVREDYSAIQKLYSDPELYRYLGRGQNFVEKHPSCLFHSKGGFMRKRHVLRFVIQRREDEAVAGELMLYNIEGDHYCKIGCRILREYHNKGTATEATVGILNYFREERVFEVVQADVMCGNVASCRALEKSGFVQEGLLYGGRYYRYMARQKQEL